MQTAYKEILDRLTTMVPSLRMIDLDRGQLDQPGDNNFYDSPAVFIYFGNIPWASIGEQVNHGNAEITFRLAFRSYHDSSSLTPEEVRASALLDLGIRQSVNAALQGFSGSNFNPLQHVNTAQEGRDDGLLVFAETYSTVLIDNSAASPWSETEASFTIKVNE